MWDNFTCKSHESQVLLGKLDKLNKQLFQSHPCKPSHGTVSLNMPFASHGNEAGTRKGVNMKSEQCHFICNGNADTNLSHVVFSVQIEEVIRSTSDASISVLLKSICWEVRQMEFLAGESYFTAQITVCLVFSNSNRRTKRRVSEQSVPLSTHRNLDLIN